MAQDIQLPGKIHQSFFEDKQKSIFKASFDQDCAVNNGKVCSALWREKLPSKKNEEPAGQLRGEIYNINEVQSLNLPLISFKQKHMFVQFCVFSKSVKIDGGSAKSQKVEMIPIDRSIEDKIL